MDSGSFGHKSPRKRAGHTVEELLRLAEQSAPLAEGQLPPALAQVEADTNTIREAE